MGKVTMWGGCDMGGMVVIWGGVTIWGTVVTICAYVTT